MEQNFHTMSDPILGPPDHSDNTLGGHINSPDVTLEAAPYAPSDVSPRTTRLFGHDAPHDISHDYIAHDVSQDSIPDATNDATLDAAHDSIPSPDGHAAYHQQSQSLDHDLVNSHESYYQQSPDRDPANSHEAYHQQSLSHDQNLANSQNPDDVDRSARYETPPTAVHPQSISRPPSALSGGGGDRHATYGDRDGNGVDQASSRNQVVIKVGMVGDAQIGKTSLMVKYVEGSWDEDYIQTLGVNFMEKTISIRNTEITFSIWDLGGQREFVNMLPLVCNDAVAILFMFDLTRKSTLNSIKEWYRQGRGFNKTAIPVLVGTKYDHFVNFSREEQEEISNQARRFAKAMRASLIFSSTSHSINVQKIFKIVLSKAFDLKCTIPEIENVGEPLLLYQSC